jgi:hypothetical protein
MYCRYYNRENKESEASNIAFSNPKVPDSVKSYRNCDSCDIYRAKLPETTCQNCWISQLVCIREGCNNKVRVKDCYCETCSREQLYDPKCENEKCDRRVSPDCRFCFEHKSISLIIKV